MFIEVIRLKIEKRGIAEFGGHGFKHLRGVAGKLVRTRRHEKTDRTVAFKQLTRNDIRVPAVVPLPRENHELRFGNGGGKADRGARNGASRVFHQGHPRNSIFINRAAVQPAHPFGGIRFHIRILLFIQFPSRKI